MSNKYHNHNSTLFDPKPIPNYVSPDGMFAVIPCGKKWMLIYNGDRMGVSSSFDIAMRKLEKLKNTYSKSQKRTRTPAKQKYGKNTKVSSEGKGSGDIKTSIKRDTLLHPKINSDIMNFFS